MTLRTKAAARAKNRDIEMLWNSLPTAEELPCGVGDMVKEKLYGVENRHVADGQG